jgi:DoxX-like family
MNHPRQNQPIGRRRVYSIRTIAYWLFTVLVAYEMVAGAMWDLLRIEYVRVVLTRLGYPLYLLFILGVWKLPCAVAILVPRFLRLKEWAYAGAFFNYSGAFASHVLVGDGPIRWVWPLVFSVFTLASWAFRPHDRLLPQGSSPPDVRLVEWVVPIAGVAVMLVLSLISLPQGPPP